MLKTNPGFFNNLWCCFMFNIVIKDEGVRYTLKTTMYLLSRVPSKVVSKTSYEPWTSRKPSLRHLYFWGYVEKVWSYNTHKKNQYLSTTSGFFLGYPEKSKTYKSRDSIEKL